MTESVSILLSASTIILLNDTLLIAIINPKQSTPPLHSPFMLYYTIYSVVQCHSVQKNDNF